MAPLRWVDSHCHLFMAEDPAELLLERAAAAGVDWLLAPGVDHETSLRAQKLANPYPDRD